MLSQVSVGPVRKNVNFSACSVHGAERTIAHASDHLPALGAVGKAVGERSMRIQTGEMRRAMDGADSVAPRRPGLMGARLKVLDALVRVLTFGRWAGGGTRPSRPGEMPPPTGAVRGAKDIHKSS